MLSNGRKLLVGVLPLALLVGCSHPAPGEAKNGGKSAQVTSQVMAVGSGRGDEQFSGIVRGRLNATLSSKIAARVLNVGVREGDPIRAGELLAQLDPRETDAGVQSSKAGVIQAQAQLAGAVTGLALEQSVDSTGVAQAEARLAAAQAGLSAATARRDLVFAGPRPEEKEQARQARVAAEAQLVLAKANDARARDLYAQGAVSKREADQAASNFQSAEAALASAKQAERLSLVGSREEDKRAASDSVKQAQAMLHEAQAGLEQAKAMTQRSEIQARQADAARAFVGQSLANAQAAEALDSETRLVAPFDGVLVTRFVDPGAMAMPGTPLLAVEGGGLRLETNVPEDQMSRFRVGMSATVRIDAIDAEYTGKVAEIVPQGDPTSHMFLVRINLPDDRRIKSGMFGRAAIVGSKRQGLWVDKRDLLTRDGLPIAFVAQSGEAHLRIVTLGKTDGSRVEVLSGLSVGDHVILNPDSGLRDGMPVEETLR